MRKIIAGLSMSLDGVVGSPDKWQLPYFNDEMGAAIGGLMAAGDTLLLGRRTYEEFATAFAHQTGDEIADRMNNTPKIVVSTTLTTAAWQNSTLLNGNVVAELTRLKQRTGGTINVSGSATLVRSLLHDHLLDELHLLIHPIVVGNGIKLFEDAGGQYPLTLVASKTFTNGVLALTYTPANG